VKQECKAKRFSAVESRDPLQAKVAVVVLCFNERKWLDKCLSSVLASQDQNFQVFLVDNASRDESVAFVEQSFPSVTIVRNAANLGFTGGNNEGIRAAIAAGVEFVFLLNPDTWVESSLLGERRAHFAGEPALDVVTAIILNYEADRFDQNFCNSSVRRRTSWLVQHSFCKSPVCA
jgi:GT2 family glycosyltransferase